MVTQNYADTSQEACRDAANRIKNWVTQGGWREVSYADVAFRTDPNIDRLPQLAKPKLAPVWDYGWVNDLTERRRRRGIHQQIANWVREAQLPGSNAERFVRLIVPYVADREMTDLATQALGVIHHSSAADTLIAEIERDIAVVGTDEHYQEFVHRTAFWAPMALGHLDYSRDPAGYRRAEAALLRLRHAQTQVRFNISTMLDDGLTGLGSVAYRNILRDDLRNQRNIWQSSRAISTLNDHSFITPLYNAAKQTRDERNFMTLIRTLAQMRQHYEARGINPHEMFAGLVEAFYEKRFIQNGDVAIALVQIKPRDCVWAD